MSDMSKLEPCLCGGTAAELEHPEMAGLWRVACQDSDCLLSTAWYGPDGKYTGREWARRGWAILVKRQKVEAEND